MIDHIIDNFWPYALLVIFVVKSVSDHYVLEKAFREDDIRYGRVKP